MTTRRSPLIPLFLAACPCPWRVSCMPASTPAGILTFMVSRLRISPEPEQFLQGFDMIFPSPLHCWHVERVIVWPRKLLVTLCTSPVPLHAGQVFMSELFLAPLPEHSARGTLFSMLISFSTPLAISSRVSLTLTRMSRPRETLC